MTKPKPLRMRHMVFLNENKLDYKDYLFIKADSESYTFLNKKTGKEICLRR